MPKTQFRQRLYRILLPSLGLTLLAVFGLLAISVMTLVHLTDKMVLETEYREIGQYILHGNRMEVADYHWEEPHHQFAHARIDPFFVQVFDTNANLLYQTPNINELKAYPSGRLPLDQVMDWHKLQRPLHILTLPLLGAQQQTLGYLQVGRYIPDHSNTFRWVWGLGSLTVLFMLGLWSWLLRRVSAYVTKPLEEITQAAEQISAQTLGFRIPLPATTDHETAQLTETLNALLTRLENSFNEVKAFTSNAAHELQTPLTALLGTVEVTLKRPRSAEAYQETLEALKPELEGMQQMVKGLLALARLNNTTFERDAEVFDLYVLVEKEIVWLKAQLSGKNVGLSVVGSPELYVKGLAHQLGLVVHNVLDNAFKYTKEGKICISLEEKAGKAILTIQDTGMGIHPEDLPKIGQRFFRSTEVSAAAITGSGLGLALVKAILEKHHGQFTLESVWGKGTAVTVSLPLVAP